MFFTFRRTLNENKLARTNCSDFVTYTAINGMLLLSVCTRSDPPPPRLKAAATSPQCIEREPVESDLSFTVSPLT